MNEAWAKKPQLVSGERCYDSLFPFQSVTIHYLQSRSWSFSVCAASSQSYWYKHKHWLGSSVGTSAESNADVCSRLGKQRHAMSTQITSNLKSAACTDNQTTSMHSKLHVLCDASLCTSADWNFCLVQARSENQSYGRNLWKYIFRFCCYFYFGFRSGLTESFQCINILWSKSFLCSSI